MKGCTAIPWTRVLNGIKRNKGAEQNIAFPHDGPQPWTVSQINPFSLKLPLSGCLLRAGVGIPNEHASRIKRGRRNVRCISEAKALNPRGEMYTQLEQHEGTTFESASQTNGDQDWTYRKGMTHNESSWWPPARSRSRQQWARTSTYQYIIMQSLSPSFPPQILKTSQWEIMPLIAELRANGRALLIQIWM